MTIQAADGGQNRVLLFIGTKAGHGAGELTDEQIAYYTDTYAFLFEVLGM